jgi:hypothetical protein
MANLDNIKSHSVKSPDTTIQSDQSDSEKSINDDSLQDKIQVSKMSMPRVASISSELLLMMDERLDTIKSDLEQLEKKNFLNSDSLPGELL